MSEKRKYSRFYIQNLAQNNMEGGFTGGSQGVRGDLTYPYYFGKNDSNLKVALNTYGVKEFGQYDIADFRPLSLCVFKNNGGLAR